MCAAAERWRNVEGKGLWLLCSQASLRNNAALTSWLQDTGPAVSLRWIVLLPRCALNSKNSGTVVGGADVHIDHSTCRLT